MRKILVLLLLTLSSKILAQSILPGEESAIRAVRDGIQIPAQAPNRGRGTGPFETLIIKDVMLISGEGAPPRGPVSIVIKNDLIESIVGSAPSIANAEVIDASSMYALPFDIPLFVLAAMVITWIYRKEMFDINYGVKRVTRLESEF